MASTASLQSPSTQRLHGALSDQRDFSVKVIGRFVVTYWLEPEKIVRVVRINRIKAH